jgi:PAS domain-containing protein
MIACLPRPNHLSEVLARLAFAVASRFWASVVIEPIYDDEGHHIGFAKITRDVTVRRATQEVLEQSERQLRLLVAGVIDYSLFMLDPNGVVANWR